MTISSVAPRIAGPYSGTGAVVTFPFAFKVFADVDVQVLETATATGVVTPRVLHSGYTVLLNPNQDDHPGGTITYRVLGVVTPQPIGTTLTIVSNVAYTQPVDLQNRSGFYADVIEKALDRAIVLIQQVLGKMARLVVTSPVSVIDPTLPAPVPGNVIGWNNTGTGFVNILPVTTDLGVVTDASVSPTAGIASSKLSFLFGAAGAFVRTMLAKLSDTPSIKDFGAKGDGTTDDTAAAIAAYAVARHVFWPAGTYRISGFTLPGGAIRGAGRDFTIIMSTTATGDVITYNGPGQTVYNGGLCGPMFEHFSVKHEVGRTAGADIRMAPASGEIAFTSFSHLLFDGSWDGLYLHNASHSSGHNLKFINAANHALFVDNTNNPDSGDSTFSDCTFNWGAVFSGDMVGVFQESSGGLRLNNAKMLGGKSHYVMAAKGNTPIADFTIMGGSYELAINASLLFYRASGTVSWGSINIIGPQFGGNGGADIQMTDPSTGFLSDVHIVAANCGQLGASGLGMAFDYVNGVRVLASSFSGSNGTSGGISNGANTINGRFRGNSFRGVANEIVNTSSSSTIDDRQTGITSANTGSSVSYGDKYATAPLAVVYPLKYSGPPNLNVKLADGTGGGMGIIVTNEVATGFTWQAFGGSPTATINVRWSAS